MSPTPANRSVVQALLDPIPINDPISELDIPKPARATDGIVEVSAGFRDADLPRLPAVPAAADRKPTDAIRKAHVRPAGALGGSLVSWPGATHDLHLSHPDETLAAVRELVGRVTGSR